MKECTYKLIGLEGISEKEVDALFITDSSNIEQALNKYVACTSAGDNGAINIWKDDKGIYKCHAMRFCITRDKQTYTDISDVIIWADKWLKQIN